MDYGSLMISRCLARLPAACVINELVINHVKQRAWFQSTARGITQLLRVE